LKRDLLLILLLLAGCGTISPTPQPASVTLALLGDVMLGRAVQPSAETFAYLAPYLDSADLTLANLESPLTDAPPQTESPYVLCAPPGNVQYLAEAGFDLLTLANNHSLDCGENGLAETQATLTESSLGFVGPGPEPVYRQVNGIRLAFLAFNALSDDFDLQTAVQAVQSARGTGAVVLVSIHWGAEYHSAPSQGQKQIGRQLSEAGAALVWGHHPHVLQRMEWLNDGKTLVFYSLGNALFDQYGLDNTRQSALALVKLDQDGIVDVAIQPFVIDVPASRLVEANPSEAQAILQYFK